MKPLVRASLATRALVRRGHGLLAILALAGFAVLRGVRQDVGPADAAAAAVWLVLLMARARRWLADSANRDGWLDAELGGLAAVGLEAALARFEGGPSGRLAPATYLFVAFVAAFARPLACLFVVAWILGLEAALHFGRPVSPADLGAFVAHAAFLGAFALLNLVLLRAEIARVRATARARVQAQLVRIKEDARSYRLLGAGEGGDRDDVRNDRLARASVEEIHQSVHYALDLLRRSLDLHTAVLLWLNDAGTHLRISELSTASDDVRDTPIAAGDGVLGAVLAQRARVSLQRLAAELSRAVLLVPVPGASARGASRGRRRDAARGACDRPHAQRAVYSPRRGDRGPSRAVLPASDPK